MKKISSLTGRMGVLILFSFSLLFTPVLLSAQVSRTIKGIVKDETGNPLEGVSVLLKGTSVGTTTGDDGAFSLQINKANPVLEFSSTGYEERSLKLGESNEVMVTLKSSSATLETVVVNSLGFKTKRDKNGSSVSIIRAQEMTRSGETNLLNSMAGKASGVKITRANGDPGAGTNVQIRGANTVSGSAQPLVIVDGVPVSNSNIVGEGSSRAGGVSQQSRLNDLNPADIESVQVLKGASAASLWGSRAANGVIVITTKQGKKNQALKISATSTVSFDEINRRHPMQTTFGQGTNGVFTPNHANSWGDKIALRAGGPDDVNTTGQYFRGDITGRNYYPITKKNSREIFTDANFNRVFQTGSSLDNAITITGGGANSTNFFSIGRLDQEGIIKNSDYTRTTIRYNNQTFFGDKVSLTTKTNYVNVKSNRIQQNSNTAGLYLGLLRTSPDFDGTDYKGTYFDAAGFPNANRHRTYRNYLGATTNPVWGAPDWTANEQKGTSDVNRFIVNANLNYNPKDWLNFDLRGGVDFNQDRRVYFFPIYSPGADRENGLLQEETIGEKEINFDAIARVEFDKIKGGDITFNGTVGWNANDRSRRGLFTETRKLFTFSRTPTFSNGAQDQLAVINNARFIRSYRTYAVTGLSYKDQFFINASGTAEMASTISSTFVYPSVDAAWQFHKLELFQNSKFLSFGKLRAAWGQVGVQPDPHRFETTYETFSYSSFDDPLNGDQFGGGFRFNNNRGNANLKPEIKTEWEIGTDLRFWRDRISLGVAYYSNTIKDILLDVPINPSTGYTTIYTNAAKMQNKGFDIELDVEAFKYRDFRINVYGNFNNNKNTVLELAGVNNIDLTTQSVSSRAVVGLPLGALFGTKPLRDAKGDMILDANGFPSIAPAQGVIGDPNPDWRGGAGVNARWKDLSLNVLFETYQGADFAERTRFVLYNFGTHADVGNEVTLTKDLKNVNGVVFPAGTTVRGNIGNFGGGDVLLDERWYTTRGGGLGSSVINEFSIRNGSWTRLREVSLSYTLKAKALQKYKIASLEFSAIGRNLALWTEVLGIDPEVNQFGVTNGFGIEYFTNPSTRSWVGSIKVNF